MTYQKKLRVGSFDVMPLRIIASCKLNGLCGLVVCCAECRASVNSSAISRAAAKGNTFSCPASVSLTGGIAGST
jgi:hypothetical protein